MEAAYVDYYRKVPHDLAAFSLCNSNPQVLGAAYKEGTPSHDYANQN